MALYTAFPDFKTNITEIIAEDDRVLVFTNTTGTHQGPFEFAPGIDPTGKVLSFQTADLYTIAENGTIVEHQDVIEIMDMLQKMGAIQFVTNSFIFVIYTSTIIIIITNTIGIDLPSSQLINFCAISSNCISNDVCHLLDSG